MLQDQDQDRRISVSMTTRLLLVVTVCRVGLYECETFCSYCTDVHVTSRLGRITLANCYTAFTYLHVRIRVACQPVTVTVTVREVMSYRNISRWCRWWYKKVKVAHTRLPSVGFRSWSRFLAVSLQVMWVINPAVGCHYFPPGPQLPPQPLTGLLPVLLLGEQRHNGCEQFA